MSGKANNYRQNFLRIFYFFFIAVVILSAATVEKAWCKPKNIEQAKKIAKNWRLSEKAPLNSSLGHNVKDAVTYSDETATLLYHIIYLETGGFIIVSADDLIEPIIAFSSSGTYDSSDDNPLGALVSKDMQNRIAWAKSEQKRINKSTEKSTKSIKSTASQKKWTLLENDNDLRLEYSYSIQGLSVSDERVAPLIQSKWSQSNVGGSACYNYYTPNNYVCGCTATALSQVLRYHQWPQNGVGTASFNIAVDGVSRSESLMGGDGLGGPYRWDNMPLVPDSAITLEERQAIGRLTHDAGASIGMSYTSGSSGATLWGAANALRSTFGYSSAVYGNNSGGNVSDASLTAINTNLDADLPVMLSIRSSSAGHAIVADGYGYNAATLYHHLNMGWGGLDDAWYNLPNVDAYYDFNTINFIVYNIFKTGSGEIASGRITDFNGYGLAGAVVTATNGSQNYSATSNDKGIYALWPLPSNTTYTVSVNLQGYSFSSRVTTTDSSSYDNSGNIWGLNFSTTNPYYPLSISKAGTVYGTIISSPGGINCGSICSYFYNSGAVVTLTANPAATFTGWSGGGCSGKGTCFVTMDEAKNITATFTVPTGAVQLPQTGQTACYDESGNVISCVGTGQDGEKRAGAAWPSPRFSDNGDQTMTDNLTGLIWTKDGNLMVTRDSGLDNDGTANDGRVTWQHALDYIKKLNQENYLGHNDWRLPNRKELKSLVNRQQANTADWLNDQAQGFSNVQSNYYWSSSICAYSTNDAWLVYMGYGSVDYVSKADYYYVWPVRGGQSGSFGSSVISLPRTGQTTCWDTSGNVISCTGTGQDGELQTGLFLPDPRFIDDGNQTVMDNLTGLIWTKDAGTPTVGICTGGRRIWQGSLDYVKCLNTNNYLGHNDWRLPNVEELESLVDLQNYHPSLPVGYPFSNIDIFRDPSYWCSSTDANYANKAWVMNVNFGYVSSSYKSDSYYVWPVRGGQSGGLGSLYASFTNAGIWKYSNAGTDWTQTTSSNPQLLVTVGSDLYGTFEGLGIWKFNGTEWTQTTTSVPQMIVGSATTLYGAFSGLGIWQWNGSAWTQTTSSNPQKVVASTSDLYGTFAGLGIWKWNGTTWTQLTTSIPDLLVTSGTKLYGTFAGLGIWLWNGTQWVQATPNMPQMIAANSTTLYGTFEGQGIWSWDGASTWTQISTDTPTKMVASGTELFSAFAGIGVKKWDGTSWTMISGNEPVRMVVGQ